MSAPPVAVRSRMFREMGSLLWVWSWFPSFGALLMSARLAVASRRYRHRSYSNHLCACILRAPTCCACKVICLSPVKDTTVLKGASCRYDCSCSQFSLLGHGHLPSSSLKTTISSMKSSQGHGAVVVFSSGSVFWVHLSHRIIKDER
ncbi:hypothetical protein BKA83DRAFT_1328221 [Pisolithus microcarpus]|nr:hypothetical protein BKA83DRAFT_1328221 [Pisolithus microcarpus]